MSSIIWTDPERPREESWSPRQVSRRISPSGFRSPRGNLFGVTFHSISAVLIYDFSVHGAHNLPWLRTALQFVHDQYIASWTINQSDDNTWSATMCTFRPEVTPQNRKFFLSLLAFFFFTQEQLCSGWMAHLEFIINNPVVMIIRFSCQLIFFLSFCTQSRLRGNHCLRSLSSCTVCMVNVCPLRRWRR